MHPLVWRIESQIILHTTELTGLTLVLGEDRQLNVYLVTEVAFVFYIFAAWNISILFYSLHPMQLSHYYKEKFWEAKKAVHEGVKYSCRQCENKTTIKHKLAEQKMALNDRVQHPCTQCNYQGTWMVSLV